MHQLYHGRIALLILFLIYILTGYQGIIIFLVILSTAIFILYIHQGKLVYQPVKAGLPRSPSANRTPLRNPSEQGLQYTDISVLTDDNVKLKGWHIKGKGQSKRVVVFFQGTGRSINMLIQDMGSKLPFVKLFIEGTNSEMIYIAYRGYSDSQGVPTEAGLTKDAQAILKFAINYCKSQTPHLKLFVLGRSLGGGVCIHGCSRQDLRSQIDGIILQNTFTSMQDIVQAFVPWFAYFPFFLKDHWKSKDKIGSITAPILFVRGLQDKLIKPTQMLHLMKTAVNSKYIADLQIPEGKHYRIYKVDTPKYLRTINQFFDYCSS